jgi:peptidylprolyl isomerase
MNRIITTLLLLMGMSATAQYTEKEGYKTTNSGLKIKVHNPQSNPQPKTGDKVSVHYTGRLTNDTVFDSSVKRGQPFQFKLGKGQVIKGWDEGIALMHKGEKATLVIPAQIGYGSRDMGKIPPNSTLIFDVELLDFEEGFKPLPYDVKGKDTVRTPSGLQIITVQENKNGAFPPAMSTVSVHYTGYLPDGSFFDSSVERGQPIQFPLGKGAVIKGWDEGIAMMRKGEKARLVIPYQLGYGENGYPPIIPPKSTLIFDCELVDFKEEVKVLPYDVAGKDTLKMPSGLKVIKVKSVPAGAKPEAGKNVTVHYTGYLTDGKVFDSSVKRSTPFTFKLGTGAVIKGWDEGIAMLKEGEKARLVIPYQLAYGEEGRPPSIPAKATLIFDVEIVTAVAP